MEFNFIKFQEFKKRKIPSRDEIPRMDRGGVEPQKRVDESAPGTLRTRPSRPRNNSISIFTKRKASLAGKLFGYRIIPIKADSSTLLSLYSLKNICQVFARACLITAVFLFVLLPLSHISAQTLSATSTTSTADLIANLQAQIKALQTRINELETELGVKPSPSINAPSASTTLPTFDRALSLGSTGDDVRNLQQFLAQDKEVYPEGLITAYYGPLTEKAIQRFQEKHGIVSAGTHDTTGYGRIGPKTRSKLNELLAEGAGKSGMIPPGLTKAPELQDKIATPPLPSGQATTTPSRTATTTPSGTITATPAQPIGHTGTTTVPATPAQPAGGQGTTTPPPSTTPPPPPPPSGTTPPPSPTPSPTPSPSPTPPPSGTDTTAPTISSVIAYPYASWGKITWNTNENADGKVEYGLTNSYGSSAASSTFIISHAIYLPNLSSNTMYHYRVISKDAAGNTTTSGDYTFTSAAVSTPSPSSTTDTATPFNYDLSNWFIGSERTAIRGGGKSYNTIKIELVSGSAQLVSFSANGLPANSSGSFLESSCLPPCFATFVLSASLTTPIGTHTITFEANGGGVTKRLGDRVFVQEPATSDVTPPVISNPQVAQVTFEPWPYDERSYRAIITWATNEQSPNHHEYYSFAKKHGSGGTFNALTTTHSFAGRLYPDTVYYYRVGAQDASGNPMVSDIMSFTTPAAPSSLLSQSTSLALVLESIRNLLGDIQKQIQKLVR